MVAPVSRVSRVIRSAALATVVGNFVAIASISRDSKGGAYAPFGIALVGAAIVIALDYPRILRIDDVDLWTHPAMILTAANVLVLFATWLWERARLSEPMALRTGHTMP